MASERQIAANRRNARNSTGPKTEAGKKRASRNALRHGLASQGSPAHFTEGVERQARQVAREIAGDLKDSIVLEFARMAAAAEFDLAQVRQVPAVLMIFGSPEAAPGHVGPSGEPEQSADALRQVVSELHSIYRYERRAASRRDSAIRKISEHVVAQKGRPRHQPSHQDRVGRQDA
jgi:hypothetical protein